MLSSRLDSCFGASSLITVLYIGVAVESAKCQKFLGRFGSNQRICRIRSNVDGRSQKCCSLCPQTPRWRAKGRAAVEVGKRRSRHAANACASRCASNALRPKRTASSLQFNSNSQLEPPRVLLHALPGSGAAAKSVHGQDWHE